MDLLPIYWYVFAGFFLGLFGQVIRVIVGIKKQYDSTEIGLGLWFNKTQLLLSLIIGGVAGFLVGLFLSGDPMDKTFYLAVIAAGYAGSDFIEGFLRTKAPKYTTEELTKAVEQNPEVKEQLINQ
ncbi:MAG: hypothetical protein CIT03_01880 [Methanobacterium sp.]|nr:MAG: hypothetical protein CIT03_01880 [Methanobacterium sp.]